MKDKKFLRALAGLLESLPVMGNMRKDMGRRLRAIADRVPESQNTEKAATPHVPSVVEIIVTDALPKGFFVYASPPPMEGMPPTISGSVVGGKLYGTPTGLGWAYAPREDAEAFKKLTLDIRDGLVSKTDIIP